MASVVLCQDERLGREVAVKRLHADQPGDVRAPLRARGQARRVAEPPEPGGGVRHRHRRRGRADRHGVRGGRAALARRCAADRSSRGTSAAWQSSSARRPRPRARPRRGAPRREAGQRAAARRRRDQARGPRDRHGRRPDPHHPQRHGARHGRLHGPRAARRAPGRARRRRLRPRRACASRRCAGSKARTGRTPMEIAHRIATEPPPDLREAFRRRRRRRPPLLARAMARDPAERPASAGELGRELRRELGSASAVPPRPASLAAARRQPRRGPPPRPRRPPRRRRGTPARTSSPPAPPTRPARTSSPRRRGWPAPCAGPAWPRSCWPWHARARAAPCSPECSCRETTAVPTARRPIGGPAVTAASSAPRRTGRMTARERRRPPSRRAPETKPEEPDPQPAPQQPAEQDPAPADQAPAPPADGPGLNDRGFALMNEGRYEEAIPLLERPSPPTRVSARDLGYAYALFNLGRSLRLAGRPADAVADPGAPAADPQPAGDGAAASWSWPAARRARPERHGGGQRLHDPRAVAEGHGQQGGRRRPRSYAARRSSSSPERQQMAERFDQLVAERRRRARAVARREQLLHLAGPSRRGRSARPSPRRSSCPWRPCRRGRSPARGGPGRARARRVVVHADHHAPGRRRRRGRPRTARAAPRRARGRTRTGSSRRRSGRLLHRLGPDRAQVDRDALLDGLGQQLERLAQPVPSTGSWNSSPSYSSGPSRARAARTISTYSRVRASGRAKGTPCQPSDTWGRTRPARAGSGRPRARRAWRPSWRSWRACGRGSASGRSRGRSAR